MIYVYTVASLKRDFAREPGVSVFLRLDILMEKRAGIRWSADWPQTNSQSNSYGFRKV